MKFIRGTIDFVAGERPGRPGEIGVNSARYLAPGPVVKQAADCFGDFVELTLDDSTGLTVCTGVRVYAEQPQLEGLE